jgi:hypothetical protein
MAGQKKPDGDFYIFEICRRLEDLGRIVSQPLQKKLDRASHARDCFFACLIMFRTSLTFTVYDVLTFPVALDNDTSPP